MVDAGRRLRAVAVRRLAAAAAPSSAGDCGEASATGCLHDHVHDRRTADEQVRDDVTFGAHCRYSLNGTWQSCLRRKFRKRL